MSGNLLKNPGFEADWGSARSHRCLVLPEDAQSGETISADIYNWNHWPHEDPVTWAALSEPGLVQFLVA